LTQTATGYCPSSANYWDIGVYGDTGPTDHSSGLTMGPRGSIISTGSYGSSNSTTNPSFSGQYCNGSRVPAEIATQLCTATPGSFANAPGCIQPGSVGVSLTVPAGVPDTGQYAPAFTLTPAATVDEGNNWINMLYGPLSLTNPAKYTAAGTVLAPLGDYNHSVGGGGVATIRITSPGSGFTTAPTVTLSAPTLAGGATATATATISNVVSAITVAPGGSGYTTRDQVVISGGGGSGATARITAVSTTGAITAITVTNFGSGYTSAPSVTFTTTTGSGASATASVASGVSAVTVTNMGTMYTASPTVAITGGGGTGAAATASLGAAIGASAYAPL
jgi:hypothetical protein